jgi:acyl-CoA thioesterase-1
MIKIPAYAICVAAAIMTIFLSGINPARAEAKKTLLVFGDSLTAGLGLPLTKAFPAQLETTLQKKGYDIKVINAGVSGETSSGGLTRLEWTLKQNPHYILLEEGANDMLRGIDPAITQENLEKILRILAAHKIPVLLAGMKAMPGFGAAFGTQYDAMYAKLAKKYAAIYYPFFLKDVAMNPALNQEDGVHPTAAGVAVIVKNITPYVEDLMRKKEGR